LNIYCIRLARLWWVGYWVDCECKLRWLWNNWFRKVHYCDLSAICIWGANSWTALSTQFAWCTLSYNPTLWENNLNTLTSWNTILTRHCNRPTWCSCRSLVITICWIKWWNCAGSICNQSIWEKVRSYINIISPLR
jgi:hypothetical protein